MTHETQPKGTEKATIYLRVPVAVRDWIDSKAKERYTSVNGIMLQALLEAMNGGDVSEIGGSIRG